MTRVDLTAYGPLVRARQYREIMAISATTLKRQLKSARCDVQPAMCRPYRWRKADLQRHLDTTSLPEDRRRKARDAKARVPK